MVTFLKNKNKKLFLLFVHFCCCDNLKCFYQMHFSIPDGDEPEDDGREPLRGSGHDDVPRRDVLRAGHEEGCCEEVVEHGCGCLVLVLLSKGGKYRVHIYKLEGGRTCETSV